MKKFLGKGFSLDFFVFSSFIAVVETVSAFLYWNVDLKSSSSQWNGRLKSCMPGIPDKASIQIICIFPFSAGGTRGDQQQKGSENSVWWRRIQDLPAEHSDSGGFCQPLHTNVCRLWSVCHSAQSGQGVLVYKQRTDAELW